MYSRRQLLADIVRRIRQHHAIEHAVIHLLAARYPHRRLAGLSDPWGFVLYTDVPEEQVRRAVGDALLHLQAGEQALAVHPNCGTNVAVGVVLATTAALLGTAGRRGFWDRLTATLVLITGALLFSQPLGFHLQRYTTLADVADRWLLAIHPLAAGNQRAYRVLFE